MTVDRDHLQEVVRRVTFCIIPAVAAAVIVGSASSAGHGIKRRTSIIRSD